MYYAMYYTFICINITLIHQSEKQFVKSCRILGISISNLNRTLSKTQKAIQFAVERAPTAESIHWFIQPRMYYLLNSAMETFHNFTFVLIFWVHFEVDLGFNRHIQPYYFSDWLYLINLSVDLVSSLFCVQFSYSFSSWTEYICSTQFQQQHFDFLRRKRLQFNSRKKWTNKHNLI